MLYGAPNAPRLRVATLEIITMSPRPRLRIFGITSFDKVVRRERVARDDALHFRRIRIGDRLSAARNAGVVDEDADRAEFGFDLADHLAVLFEIVDRCLIGARAATQRFDCRDDFGGGVGIAPIVDRNIGAVLRERQAQCRGRRRDRRRSPARPVLLTT